MKEVRKIELKDKITLAMMLWSNIIATTSLIVATVQGKRKTAKRPKPTKQKRKR